MITPIAIFVLTLQHPYQLLPSHQTLKRSSPKACRFQASISIEIVLLIYLYSGRGCPVLRKYWIRFNSFRIGASRSLTLTNFVQWLRRKIVDMFTCEFSETLIYFAILKLTHEYLTSGLAGRFLGVLKRW